MSKSRFVLRKDTKGVMWDLLLYIPTVVALLSMAAKFWFAGSINLAYLLVFLASFFCIAGANRILKTRLMLLPSAPIAIDIDKCTTSLDLCNGNRVELVKDLRYFSDYAGRTFGLAGLDKSGRRMQFVFHKGQFSNAQEYQVIQDRLRACT